MQCRICNGEMPVIFTGISTVPFVRRRRKCTGCEREVTTYENVFDPATGEYAEHMITQHLVCTPENLITAFRAMSKEAREIILEMANTGEPAFNSPRLVSDIAARHFGTVKPNPDATSTIKEKASKKTGPQPGWQQRKADRLAAEAANKGGIRLGRYKKRGPRTEEQKAATAVLKKANAEKRAQEAEKPAPAATSKDRPTLSMTPIPKAKTGHIDAVDRAITALDRKEAAYKGKTVKQPKK